MIINDGYWWLLMISDDSKNRWYQIKIEHNLERNEGNQNHETDTHHCHYPQKTKLNLFQICSSIQHVRFQDKVCIVFSLDKRQLRDIAVILE